MIRTLTALTLLAAIASPAAAAVTVKVSGKDTAAVKADISRAAELACRDELRGSVLAFRLQGACVSAAKADAMTQLNATPTYAASPTPLAVTRISASN